MNISPTSRRWLVRGAKLALVALLVWAAHATLQRALADLENPDYREHLPRLRPAWLALAGAIYLSSLAPNAYFYARLLSACRQRAGAWAAIRAFYISQIGKYAPGKALVLVVRGALLAGQGVERTVAAATVFIETLTVMAAGSLVAILSLAPTADQHAPAIAAAVGMFLLTGAAALPAVFVRVAARFGLRRFNPAAVDKLLAIPPRTLAIGWVGASIGWWLQGLSLWAVLESLDLAPANPLERWPLHTAAAALGVVAGFLTMVPAGLLGRELVLTQLMAPVYGPAPAALAAVLSRLVSLVAEGLVSTILYFAFPTRPIDGDAPEK